MVDPDKVGAGKLNRITSPNVFRVQVGDLDVLDDDVGNTIGHPQALALDDALIAHAKDGFVRRDIDRGPRCHVPGGSLRRRVSAVVLDDPLAAIAGTPGRADVARLGALRLGEVKLLVQNNDSRCGVGEHLS